MYVIVPFLFSLAKRINKKVLLTIGITLCTIIFIDEIYNLLIARIFDLPRAANIYRKLGFHYMEF